MEDDGRDAEQFELLSVVESHDFKGVLDNNELSFLEKDTALTFNRRHSERSSTPSICSLVLFRKSYFSGLSSSNRRSTAFNQTSTSTWQANNGLTSQFSFLRSLQQLVEHMKVSFTLGPSCDPTFFQQIPINVCSSNSTCWGKEYPDKFSESTRIVVSHCLGISESFQDGIRLQDLLF